MAFKAESEAAKAAASQPAADEGVPPTCSPLRTRARRSLPTRAARLRSPATTLAAWTQPHPLMAVWRVFRTGGKSQAWSAIGSSYKGR